MTYRAEIDSKVSEYKYRIRIPELNKAMNAIGATPTEELYIAVVSSSGSVTPHFKSGDKVIVNFETPKSASPVIIGALCNDKSSKIDTSAKFSTLEVTNAAKFAEDTSIGSVSAANIKCLENLGVNVQTKFNELDALDKSTASSITVLNTSSEKQGTDIEKNKQDILINQKNISTNSKEINNVKTELDNHKNNTDVHIQEGERQNWNSKANGKHTHTWSDINPEGLAEGNVFLPSSSYGTSLPEGLKEGQLYFLLKE